VKKATNWSRKFGTCNFNSYAKRLSGAVRKGGEGNKRENHFTRKRADPACGRDPRQESRGPIDRVQLKKAGRGRKVHCPKKRTRNTESGAYKRGKKKEPEDRAEERKKSAGTHQSKRKSNGLGRKCPKGIS